MKTDELPNHSRLRVTLKVCLNETKFGGIWDITDGVLVFVQGLWLLTISVALEDEVWSSYQCRVSMDWPFSCRNRASRTRSRLDRPHQRSTAVADDDHPPQEFGRGYCISHLISPAYTRYRMVMYEYAVRLISNVHNLQRRSNYSR